MIDNTLHDASKLTDLIIVLVIFLMFLYIGYKEYKNFKKGFFIAKQGISEKKYLKSKNPKQFYLYSIVELIAGIIIMGFGIYVIITILLT